MCFLHYATEDLSRAAAQRAAQHGLLFKRTAYNFVSLAHDEGTVDRTLDMLHASLREILKSVYVLTSRKITIAAMMTTAVYPIARSCGTFMRIGNPTYSR